MTLAEDAAMLWASRIVRPLRLRENEVYEISGPQGRAALRLHRIGYQSAAAIRSELWWCARLAEAGLPVSAPLPMADGSVLAMLPHGRLASVVRWIDGEALGEAGIPLAGSVREQGLRHYALGRLLAQVHAATDRLQLPDWFTRPAWDKDGLVGDSPFWGRFWEHPALTPEDAAILSEARVWLAERLDTPRFACGLVHADVLRENVLVDGQSLSLIDFDDSGFGFRLYDLGTVLSQNLFEPAYTEIRAALCDGYGVVDALDVDAFTLARTLASVGWAAPRLPKESPIHARHIDRAVMMARRCLA